MHSLNLYSCHDTIFGYRGYYIRCKAIKHVISTFLSHSDPDVKRQVLSLGAGFDASFFRLTKEGLMNGNVKYFEVCTYIVSLCCEELPSVG